MCVVVKVEAADGGQGMSKLSGEGRLSGNGSKQTENVYMCIYSIYIQHIYIYIYIHTQRTCALSALSLTVVMTAAVTMRE